MMMNTNVQAHPIEKGIDFPKYYVVHELVVPTPEAESGGLSAFNFKGKNGENYVVSIKVRQELDPLYRDEIWLNKEYIDRERSMADIADQFGITPAAINQWLNKHDIPTRSRGRNHE
jgi:hypothetical protein